jgi:hypothetical protein
MLFLYPAAALLCLFLFWLLSVIVGAASGGLRSAASNLVHLSKRVKKRVDGKEPTSDLDTNLNFALYLVVHTYPDEKRPCEWILMNNYEMECVTEPLTIHDGHTWTVAIKQVGKYYTDAKVKLLGRLGGYINNAAHADLGVNVAY